MKRRQLLRGAAALAAIPLVAHAQSTNSIKIGALLDLSGPYADVGGKTHAFGMKLALEDFGPSLLGRPIELLTADFQQKVEVSMTIARNWIDRTGVDILIDAPNSAVANALQTLVTERNKIYISGAFAADLTGKDCTTNNIRFVPNSIPLGSVPATALTRQGKKTWFFVTVDYALGHSIEEEAIKAVKREGGTVLGTVRHPFGTADFSSYLLQAQASKAEVIAFSSAGTDLDNALKQSREFGLTRTQTISALDLQFLGVPASGLSLLQNCYVAETWYWDQNAAARAFSDRFMKLSGGIAPGSSDAGLYAGLLHCLKAIQALGSVGDGRATVAKMKSMPVDTMYAPGSRIRPGGQLETPITLFRVKTPAESKEKWDVYTPITTLTGTEAWGPVETKACKTADHA